MNLSLTHTHDDRQAQRLSQLNQAIEVGMQQLHSGKKIPARESFDRIKNKINKISKEAQ